MKKGRSLFLTILVTNMFVYFFACGVVLGSRLPVSDMYYVSAQNQDIKYEYDSLGRVSSAIYPDGTEIKYGYDANGNLLYSRKSKKGDLPDSGNRPGGNTQQSGGSTGTPGSSPGQTQKPPVVTPSLHYTATDLKNYNQFKKKKPVIKSLKKSKSKKKYYLTIKIKQVKKRGLYGETGYQIKYATNKKFKKAKTIKVTRNKKSSITSKKWKVKKGKTYYVKVRALMKTKTGKTIYSKYSKVKSIKVK